MKRHFSLIIHTMMQEYNTQTHTYTQIQMFIWIFFYLHLSSLHLKPQLQVVIWQSQLYHTWQPTGVLSNCPDENIIIMENTISDIIINITHCNINYILMHKYHIIIYNIKLYKKWLTVIQTKRERKRKRITKRKSNRLREWTKEIRRK